MQLFFSPGELTQCDQKEVRRLRVTAHLVLLLASMTLLAGSAAGEWGFGLTPCQMCIWQRLAHTAAFALASAALFVAPAPRLLILYGAATAMLYSGTMAFLQTGIEYGLLKDIFGCEIFVRSDLPGGLVEPQDMVRCDKAAWVVPGVSLAAVSALFSLGAAFVGFRCLRLSQDRYQP